MNKSYGTVGIILAAGRGSRLGDITQYRPKGAVEVRGKSLLEHQIEAFNEVGIKDPLIVTGYMADHRCFAGRNTIINRHWDQGNMVSSLLVGLDHVNDVSVIVSYSDIIYPPQALLSLLEWRTEIGILSSTRYAEIWSKRFDNPLDDLESLRLDKKGDILEIGTRVRSYEDIEGQFMGLLKIGGSFLPNIIKILKKLAPGELSMLDVTKLIQLLVESGTNVGARNYDGFWMEIDGPRDIEVAEHLYDKIFTHPVP